MVSWNGISLSDIMRTRHRRASHPVAASNAGRVLRSQSYGTGNAARNSQSGMRNLAQPAQHRGERVEDLRRMLRDRESEVHRAQGQVNSLKSENRQLRSENKRLEENAESWQADYEEVRDRYYDILDTYVKPYTKMKGITYAEVNHEEVDAVLKLLSEDASEASTLRKQNSGLGDKVQALQRELLAKVDKVQAVSDNHFATEFRSLAASVKSLSRSIRVPGQVNIVEVLGRLKLLVDVSPHHWESRAQKKCLVEAWIWSILLTMVFQDPFVFFGDQGKPVTEAWNQAFGSEHLHGWPCPSPRCETWRCLTAEHLLLCVGQDTVVYGRMKAMPHGLQSSVIEARIFVTTVIEAHLDQLSGGPDVSQIRQIVDKAFGLALRMSIQRSRIQVTYPAVGAIFNENEMSFIPNLDCEDDEDIRKGVVAFVVNPGLTKWGDANGQTLDHRYDIVSSLVQLEITQPEPEQPHMMKIEEQNDDIQVKVEREEEAWPHIKNEQEDRNQGAQSRWSTGGWLFQGK